jgi:hypothetical protein
MSHDTPFQEHTSVAASSHNQPRAVNEYSKAAIKEQIIDSCREYSSVGRLVRMFVGVLVGLVGILVGILVGQVGMLVGTLVGFVGMLVGIPLGRLVRSSEGIDVGKSVGFS